MKKGEVFAVIAVASVPFIMLFCMLYFIASSELEKYSERHSEISSDGYRRVAEWCEEFPAIRFIVTDNYYTDSIIVKHEYDDIEKTYNKQVALRKRLTELPVSRESLNKVLRKKCSN